MTKSFSPGQLACCVNCAKPGWEVDPISHKDARSDFYYINPGDVMMIVDKWKLDKKSGYYIVLVNEKTVCVHNSSIELL